MFGPEEKKPFLTISGEWNGVMEYKWTDKVNIKALCVWQNNY